MRHADIGQPLGSGRNLEAAGLSGYPGKTELRLSARRLLQEVRSKLLISQLEMDAGSK